MIVKRPGVGTLEQLGPLFPARKDARESAWGSRAILIRRSWSARDDAGNTYGIVDTNPDLDDPAIAVAIRIAATGERIGRIMRRGDHIRDADLDLVVRECRTGDDPLLLLVPGGSTQ